MKDRKAGAGKKAGKKAGSAMAGMTAANLSLGMKGISGTAAAPLAQGPCPNQEKAPVQCPCQYLFQNPYPCLGRQNHPFS